MNPNFIYSEIYKCKEDPIYFIETYCNIQTPVQGDIRMVLKPFQKAYIKAYLENDKVIINKARQMGISTLNTLLALWSALFKDNIVVVILATKQQVNVNHADKVQHAYKNLPDWFKYIAPIEKVDKTTFKLSNGSRIRFISNTPIMESIDELYIDEAAWISNDNIRSVITTVNYDGKTVIASSPNGKNNYFYQIFDSAQKATNTYFPITLPWNSDSTRDIQWYERQIKGLTQGEIAEEFNCEFIEKGDDYPF